MVRTPLALFMASMGFCSLTAIFARCLGPDFYSVFAKSSSPAFLLRSPAALVKVPVFSNTLPDTSPGGQVPQVLSCSVRNEREVGLKQENRPPGLSAISSDQL